MATICAWERIVNSGVVTVRITCADYRFQTTAVVSFVLLHPRTSSVEVNWVNSVQLSARRDGYCQPLRLA